MDQQPTEGNTNFVKKAVFIVIGILVIIFILFVLQRFGLFKNLKQVSKNSSVPVQNSSTNSSSLNTDEPVKVICKQFSLLDEALKNIDIACVLNLSEQKLETVPNDISKLTKLNELSLKGNNLTKFPTEVLAATTLMSLDLSDNQITQIPAEINQLVSLQALDLSGNKLTQFPKEIGSLSVLHSLKLTGNNLGQSEKDNIKKLLPNAEIVF